MAIQPTRCALALLFAWSAAVTLPPAAMAVPPAERSSEKSSETESLAAVDDRSALPAEKPQAGKSKTDKASELRLRRVVLFTSGVGFFEHRGNVDGNAKVDLKFNVADINDLLKSMVLEDQGGGRISTITYGSRDPITKTLKTFSVDLTREPSMADLLRQVRGEQVLVELPNPVTGKILGIEQRQQRLGKDEVIDVEMLNLLTPTGLRSIPLASISEFRLLNDKLNAELQDALAILTQVHSRDKKNVTLEFLGDGQRPVRVGYIQEAPLWKTSYRLVLKDDGPPLLQGWAIVENTTEHEWQDVGLTLVNGRPISFIMDLYQPLYVARPVVAPETFASLRPQTHGQDLGAREEEFLRAGAAKEEGFGSRGTGTRGGMGGMGGGMGGMGGGSFGGGPPAKRREEKPIDPSAGVQRAAQGDAIGELFRYQIDEPVTLARQQSAMLPIVNDSVQGEKLSLYNASVQAKHPLSAVQLVNSTELHLMQGPITVFDGGEYAGDARIEDLAPGSRRLITYALDLDTEVAVQQQATPEVLVGARVVQGVMQFQHKLKRSHDYLIKNSGTRAKKVLVEQPLAAEWKLTEPEATEKTGKLYRFEVAAEPGKPATLSVAEEKIEEGRVALATFDDEGEAAVYLSAPVVSAELKKAIGEVIRRKAALAALANKRAELQRKIATVEEEQGRIRQNMAQLDRNSDLYQRYVKKFGAQEDDVEKLRPQVETLAAQEQKARADLDKYLETLNIE
jgi:uncharacterized membrane protein YgcG